MKSFNFARNLYYNEYDEKKYDFVEHSMSMQEVYDKCVYTKYGSYTTDTSNYAVLADSSKNLYANIINVQNHNTYDMGLVKIKGSVDTTDTKNTSVSDRYYRVQRNLSDDCLVVNVPWTSQSKDAFLNNKIHNTDYGDENNLIFSYEDDDEYREYDYVYLWDNSFNTLASPIYNSWSNSSSSITIYNGYGRPLFVSISMTGAIGQLWRLSILNGTTTIALRYNINQSANTNKIVNVAFVVPIGATYTVRWIYAISMVIQKWY